MKKGLKKKIEYFMETVDIKRFNKNTRSVILAFIYWEQDGGLPDFVHDHLFELDLFFELLDFMEAAQEKQKLKSQT